MAVARALLRNSLRGSATRHPASATMWTTATHRPICGRAMTLDICVPDDQKHAACARPTRCMPRSTLEEFPLCPVLAVRRPTSVTPLALASAEPLLSHHASPCHAISFPLPQSRGRVLHDPILCRRYRLCVLAYIITATARRAISETHIRVPIATTVEHCGACANSRRRNRENSRTTAALSLCHVVVLCD